MDKVEKLKLMISEYIDSMNQIRNLFREKFDSESPLGDWRDGRLNQKGSLGQFKYSFHGMGVSLESKNVEFDIEFGNEGRFGFFDAWRLSSFARNYDKFSELCNESEIDALLLKLFNEKYIIQEENCWSDSLYRIPTVRGT